MLWRIAVGANSSIDGEHLQAAADHDGESLVISSPRLFADLETSFDKGFGSWILNESDDGVLLRAAPRLLEVREGDKQRVKEFKVIVGWTACGDGKPS